MASLEIHPLSELRDEAARLLSERFAHQRAAEPLLPEVDDFSAHVPDGEEGLVATRGGEAVAYLAGEVKGEIATVGFGGHAASEPETLRDLFAVLAERWDVSRFAVAVPASDGGLIDTWFRLAFGCQFIWAVQETRPVEPVDFGGTIRSGTPDDLEAVAGFDEILWLLQARSPSFSGLTVPSRAEFREEWHALWDEEEFPAHFVAERNGRTVGPRTPRARLGPRARLPLADHRLALGQPPVLSLLAAARLSPAVPAALPGNSLVVPTTSTIALFLLAATALAVVPGPAVAYIVTQSIDQGRRAGLVSALGVASGGVVHVAAATVGLSALIASSATAFTAVKLVGAAYLIVVGIRRILAGDSEGTQPRALSAPLRRIYRQGVIVNVLNPKTALFFLAFLPQFVDPQRGAIWPQVAVLGVIFVSVAVLSDMTYALVSDAIAGRIRRTGTGAKVRRWLTGGVFVALGITAAVARRST
jgi:threonine/homoserine/homoserine lactone efflux protein